MASAFLLGSHQAPAGGSAATLLRSRVKHRGHSVGAAVLRKSKDCHECPAMTFPLPPRSAGLDLGGLPLRPLPALDTLAPSRLSIPLAPLENGLSLLKRPLHLASLNADAACLGLQAHHQEEPCQDPLDAAGNLPTLPCNSGQGSGSSSSSSSCSCCIASCSSPAAEAAPSSPELRLPGEVEEEEKEMEEEAAALGRAREAIDAAVSAGFEEEIEALKARAREALRLALQCQEAEAAKDTKEDLHCRAKAWMYSALDDALGDEPLSCQGPSACTTSVESQDLDDDDDDEAATKEEATLDLEDNRGEDLENRNFSNNDFNKADDSANLNDDDDNQDDACDLEVAKARARLALDAVLLVESGNFVMSND